MILASVVGFALQSWAGWHDAGEMGFLVGLVASLFVPTGQCRIPQR